MIKRVVVLPAAQRVLDARFWRIVGVIKTAPEDGAVVGNLADGRAIRQMTGTNMHVQYYRETFAVGPAIVVVRIFILDWKPWYIEE
jgi:hypothetical protein